MEMKTVQTMCQAKSGESHVRWGQKIKGAEIGLKHILVLDFLRSNEILKVSMDRQRIIPPDGTP